jgi:pSer/pThr/pTyr-binding forkhead associated (FHA) protein
MAKLVVLSAGLAGRTQELSADKVTIGRVEDNTFQIAEASVSSHHCEVFLRGSDVVVKDLNSTNGSFINGEKMTGEAVLKPGQTLRLGQIELKLEAEGAPASAPSASAAPAPAAASSASQKKPLDQTVVMRGVSLNELEQGPRTTGFDTASRAFSKKSNKTNQWFLIGGIIAIVVIALLIVIALTMIKKS